MNYPNSSRTRLKGDADRRGSEQIGGAVFDVLSVPLAGTETFACSFPFPPLGLSSSSLSTGMGRRPSMSYSPPLCNGEYTVQRPFSFSAEKRITRTTSTPSLLSNQSLDSLASTPGKDVAQSLLVSAILPFLSSSYRTQSYCFPPIKKLGFPDVWQSASPSSSALRWNWRQL